MPAFAPEYSSVDLAGVAVINGDIAGGCSTDCQFEI
tara:strand:- start:12316 stop:12423 length:108 start_codon:yes stop_codon:yes gene_type:complete